MCIRWHATAFAQRPDAGEVGQGGRMIDRPHLTAARRALARTAPTPN